MSARTFLRRAQFGIESVAGTPVAATWKRVGQGVLIPEQIRVDDESPRGLFGMPDDPGCLVTKRSRFQFDSKLTYEDFLWPLLCGLHNDAAPTGADPYTWEIFRDWQTEVSHRTATIEFGHLDGGATIAERESAYGFCEGFTITASKEDEDSEISERWVARADQSTTLTAALTELAGRECIPGKAWQIWIDGTWATLGTTQKLGMLDSFSLDVNPGLAEEFALDGRSDLDFSAAQSLFAGVTLELVLKRNADAETEVTAWRNGTKRAIRLRVAGSDSRQITVDLIGYYTGGPTPGDDNGADTVTLTFRGQQDDTSGELIDIQVINHLATFT